MNLINHRILLLFILQFSLFPSTTSFAQLTNDPVYVNYFYIPKQNFRNKETKVSLRITEFSVITPAIKLGLRTILNNSVNYRFSDYRYREITPSVFSYPEKLNDIRYTLIIRHQFNKQWTMLAIPRVNLRGNFDYKLSRDDFFFGLAAVAFRKSQLNEAFSWGLGFSYNNDFGKNIILPLLGVNYLSQHWRINLMLPSSVNMTFLHSNKLEYGFSYNSDASIFHTRSVVDNSDAIQFTRTLNLFFSPSLSYKIFKNTWINARAGYVLSRTLDFYNGDFKSPSDSFKNPIEATPFANLGLSLRFHEPNKEMNKSTNQ